MPVDLSGGRHYRMPAQLPPWTCPACGVENTGPLDQGCASCGSGKPGRKAPTYDPVLQTTTTSAPADKQPTFLRDAFRRWRDVGYRDGYDHPGDEAALVDAFVAGYEYAMQLIAENPPSTSTSSTSSTPTAPTEIVLSPVIARTLAVGLSLMIEQILVGDPEEVASGEWIDWAAAKALLEQLQEKGKEVNE